MLIDYCGVVYSICFPKELWIKASAKCLKYGLGYLTMDSENTLRQKHCVHNITVHLSDMTHLTPVNKSESKPKKKRELCTDLLHVHSLSYRHVDVGEIQGQVGHRRRRSFVSADAAAAPTAAPLSSERPHPEVPCVRACVTNRHRTRA